MIIHLKSDWSTYYLHLYYILLEKKFILHYFDILFGKYAKNHGFIMKFCDLQTNQKFLCSGMLLYQ
jgi:carbohydrate-selective porin OprB